MSVDLNCATFDKAKKAGFTEDFVCPWVATCTGAPCLNPSAKSFIDPSTFRFVQPEDVRQTDKVIVIEHFKNSGRSN